MRYSSQKRCKPISLVLILFGRAGSLVGALGGEDGAWLHRLRTDLEHGAQEQKMMTTGSQKSTTGRILRKIPA